MIGYWYCENCNLEVDGKNVTFEEYHDLCGCPVNFIDSHDDMIEKYNLLNEDIKLLKQMQEKAFKYDAIQYVLRNGIFDNRKGGNFDVQLAVDVYELHMENK